MQGEVAKVTLYMSTTNVDISTELEKLHPLEMATLYLLSLENLYMLLGAVVLLLEMCMPTKKPVNTTN